MGYETKMLVVEKNIGMNHYSCMIEELHATSTKEQFKKTVYNCFKESDGSFSYYPDHTKITVPSGAIVKEGPWCHIIGMVELSKGGTFPGICKFEDSNGDYVYDPFDGNKILGLDGYGDYRKFVPIQEVINILQEHIKEAKAIDQKPYRRYVAALGLLKGIKLSFYNGPTHEIGCLFYGH
ncbi:MAG: hypothetical protein NT096_00060 [Proteobacteria bacterium]|nr:hypothetical protein [Pseudomonadota bacterium]